MAENQDDSTSQGQPMSSFAGVKPVVQLAKPEVVVEQPEKPEVAPVAPVVDVVAKPLPYPLQNGVTVRSL